ncbi:helix-turn-helix transcriptional regulator [Novosphingobium flavum]|uniref:helix-turn-helix transcriptional regulator n=1 Tax=Novosphingobium aerophilum TaxID=2839843 RepID=UPI00163A2C6C|nr:AraC family transcriptional regulator [Novosphingobium aerophilum]MBC2663807.1 helix-turn-helix transcriptional regulator [Novosphingobium aerophilum]
MADAGNDTGPHHRIVEAGPPASGQFTHYLENRSLPTQHAEVRHEANESIVVTLVDHLPSAGIWFDAIEDLIISVVMKSNHSPVTRDLGSGPFHFTERPGCILVTPPRTRSFWMFSGNPLVLHLSVPAGRVDQLAGCSGLELQHLLVEAARRPIYDGLLSQLAVRMWSALEHSTVTVPGFGYQALGTILSLVLQNAADTRQARLPRSAAAVAPLAAWRLRRVTSYMSLRLGEPPRINELAKLVELSPDYFSRSFAATTGMTPHEWQSNLRIEEAKRLLRESNMSMTEIAHRLAFSSSAHFSTRFRQLVGLSPSEWRGSFTED